MNRIKHLPKTILKYSGKKEEVLELQHIKNVLAYDFQLGNLLKDAIMAENNYTKTLEDMKYNIPF